ncbi:hypothetical protein ACNOYE_23915 [Nannocystaceae bacterium ST9]
MPGPADRALLVSFVLLAAACADKAPPALFPHPQPPAMARPVTQTEPDCSRPEAANEPACQPPSPSAPEPEPSSPAP